MTTTTMTERYLGAVGSNLPASKRDDIIRELSENIDAQMEDEAESLGRPLDDDEQAAILDASATHSSWRRSTAATNDRSRSAASSSDRSSSRRMPRSSRSTSRSRSSSGRHLPGHGRVDRTGALRRRRPARHPVPHRHRHLRRDASAVRERPGPLGSAHAGFERRDRLRLARRHRRGDGRQARQGPRPVHDLRPGTRTDHHRTRLVAGDRRAFADRVHEARTGLGGPVHPGHRPHRGHPHRPARQPRPADLDPVPRRRSGAPRRRERRPDAGLAVARQLGRSGRSRDGHDRPGRCRRDRGPDRPDHPCRLDPHRRTLRALRAAPVHPVAAGLGRTAPQGT